MPNLFGDVGVPVGMDAEFTSDDTSTLASTVSPEDVRPGDYVAILNRIYEVPSYLWCGEFANSAPEVPVRIRWRTREGGRPLKVKAICLPFVLIKTPKGRYRSIDVRQVQLVRLKDRYARTVWKKLRQQEKQRASDLPSIGGSI